MATNAVIRLTFGPNRVLDLTTGRYEVESSFIPPTVNRTPQYAAGGMANRIGGATLIGTKSNNIDWAFQLTIRGGSEADIRRGATDLQQFLNLASTDPNTPLYLEFRPNSDTPEPIWGNYGTNLHYEIVKGDVSLPAHYGIAPLRTGSGMNAVTVTLNIKPYATGAPQRLLSATGGIIEDNTGKADGFSTGVIIPEVSASGGNLYTNPVFGNTSASGWATSWLNGACMLSASTIDSRFVLFGQVAAKLVSSNSANNTFVQSLTLTNASTYTFSNYVKLPDSSSPTTADVAIWYNAGSIATTITAEGDNGWYRLSGCAAGNGAAASAGVRVGQNRTVFVDGFQVEKKGSYPTPFFYGDLLGCAWSGTAHQSSSTRTAGRAKLVIDQTNFSAAQGAIRVVFRAMTNSTNVGAAGAGRIFMDSNSNLRLIYINGSYTFSDGINSAGVTDSFSQNDVVIIHAVYGQAGLALYRNGVSIQTNGTYTQPPAASALFIGSDTAAATQCDHTFEDFAIFDQQLTSAQVLNDYNNLAAVVDRNERIGAIPWLWTQAGNDQAANLDSSASQNYIVCGGVPGNIEARTFARMTANGNSSGPTDIYLSNWINNRFLPPSCTLVGNTTGSINLTSASVFLSPVTASGIFYDTLENKEFRFFVSGSDAGTATSPTLINFEFTNGNYSVYDTDFNLGTTTCLQISLPVYIPTQSTLLNITRDSSYSVFLYLYGKRRAGVTGTYKYSYDFVEILPRPLTRIVGLGNVTSPSVFYQGMLAIGRFEGPRAVQGDPFEIVPNKFNTVISLQSNQTFGVNSTFTLVYDQVLVTPRWSLLS